MHFKIIYSFLFSFAICLLFGQIFIDFLRKFQGKGQPIRDDGPASHHVKVGTPTMGGLIILLSAFCSGLLFADITNKYILLVWFVILSHAGLGFLDDYLKVKKANVAGVRGKVKLMAQCMISLIACLIIQDLSPDILRDHILIPFFKETPLYLGYLYIPFVLFVIIGSSNAVNLTDGLDGLAAIPVSITLTFFGMIAYSFIANDTLMISDTAELSILCASLIGGLIGFLWYNSYPAQIFMGDVGSLSLGAGIGVMSVILKHEIWLAVVGIVFVIETLSVIIQVYYFKFTGGKRIFLMAPIHHHFEKKGNHEVKVVIRFWIVSIISAIIGILIL